MPPISEIWELYVGNKTLYKTHFKSDIYSFAHVYTM